MHQLQEWLSSRFQQLFFLEILFQQGVAHQEISEALFLQNVCKNKILTNIVQLVKKETKIIDIHQCLTLIMHFSLRKNIFDSKDINCFSFFLIKSSIFFVINIYSDEHQSILKYLKDTEANIWNILVIAGNFNIKDRKWYSSYSFHLSYSDSLIKVTNSFELKLSSSIHQILTYYTDNSNDSNSVIDLIFLQPNSVKIDNHFILPEFWHLLDHASLTVDISIIEEFIQEK